MRSPKHLLVWLIVIAVGAAIAQIVQDWRSQDWRSLPDTPPKPTGPPYIITVLIGQLGTGPITHPFGGRPLSLSLTGIISLPGAPTAVGSVELDVENLVMYQSALATHAKRDEQLRTLGSLLGRILR